MKNQEITWLLREKYRGQKTEGFLADCARLEAGAPLAYLIGSIPFLDCTISLASKPLIPRPETEFWTEKAITEITLKLRGLTPKFMTQNRSVDTQGSPRQGLGEPWAGVYILDLCAGSGAIGVAVAKACPEAYVAFAELDAAHFPTIKQNLAVNLAFSESDVPKRFSFHPGNLFNAVPPNTRFDFILCNPPYIDAAADTVDANVAEHEPHLALFGGARGLELIARIIEATPSHLNPQGQLWLEHEPFQVEAIAALADQHGFAATHHADQYGTVRYSILTYPVAK